MPGSGLGQTRNPPLLHLTQARRVLHPAWGSLVASEGRPWRSLRPGAGAALQGSPCFGSLRGGSGLIVRPAPAEHDGDELRQPTCIGSGPLHVLLSSPGQHEQVTGGAPWRRPRPAEATHEQFQSRVRMPPWWRPSPQRAQCRTGSATAETLRGCSIQLSWTPELGGVHRSTTRPAVSDRLALVGLKRGSLRVGLVPWSSQESWEITDALAAPWFGMLEADFGRGVVVLNAKNSFGGLVDTLSSSRPTATPRSTGHSTGPAFVYCPGEEALLLAQRVAVGGMVVIGWDERWMTGWARQWGALDLRLNSPFNPFSDEQRELLDDLHWNGNNGWPRRDALMRSRMPRLKRRTE